VQTDLDESTRGVETVGDLVRFRLDGGGSVIVEVEEEPGVERASRHGKLLEDARSSFEEALGSVRDVAAAAMGQFRSMVHRPDEVEIKFGIRLDAKTGAIIAQAGVQGQIEIRVRCSFSDRPAADGNVEDATEQSDGE
jgi:hypothetical protein